MDFSYESLSRQLHQRFPQLSEQKYTSLIGNINVDAEPFVLFGVIFNHYVVELASSSDAGSKRNVATFLEDMASSSDSHVGFLFTSELLPTLVRDQATVDSFWPLLGPLTRRNIHLLPPRFLANINLPTSC